jgi:SAM-dependent methyltransferase
MKVRLDAFYVKRKPKRLKLEYDKSGKLRPAWILIKNAPKHAAFARFGIDGKMYYYIAYLTTSPPLYLPTTYSPEEMSKYYNKFSQYYDEVTAIHNMAAAKMLVAKIAKRLPKDAKILDVGAGSGMASEQLAARGYKNTTLVDFSPKMLARAKKKKILKGCKFVIRDIRKLNLGEKFDLVISIFSFGLSYYYKEFEMPGLWKIIAKHMRKGGILALFANDFNPPNELFKTMEKGTYLLSRKYQIPYYVGLKR